jgi:cyclopropane-fatty-acyl-phospholipid synthase
MAEHVGESRIDLYASSLFTLLRPGGRLLNHAIAALDPDHEPLEDIFSTRYVFPDGEPLPLSRVELALERAGFETDHVEGFRDDYSLTLRHWSERLDEHLDEARSLAGEQRTRVWRLYLRAARHGFDTGHTAVYQIGARRDARPRPGEANGSAGRSRRQRVENGWSWQADGQGPVANVHSRSTR